MQLGAGQRGLRVPQRPARRTQWYHDHTLGLTRLNVYAGTAGFYLLRGGPGDLPSGVLPGPAPAVGDPPEQRYYEIPLAIQDRSFNADGSLFYPDSRAFFDGFPGPYAPESDVPPIWNPEFFGNTMVVNGSTWPVLAVEPRRYRLRVLNGCNSRFLSLKLASDPVADRPAPAVRPFWMIGAEGGFLPQPVQLDQLLLAPAERADVIVDFTGLAEGTAVYLLNEGPDTPFPADPGSFADRGTTGRVMKFEVTPLSSDDTSAPPGELILPQPPTPGDPTRLRQVSLNELGSAVLDFGPVAALLGALNSDGTGQPLRWDDPITENPDVNAVEIWELYNFTPDAHPIHIHEVLFQVVDRRPLNPDGVVQPPEASESGLKDTVIAYPDQITRVKALFDRPGQYVWHCHIVEHEDNEMMRPYHIGPIPSDLPGFGRH